jgi:hypothetical protein
VTCDVEFTEAFADSQSHISLLYGIVFHSCVLHAGVYRSYGCMQIELEILSSIRQVLVEYDDYVYIYFVRMSLFN